MRRQRANLSTPQVHMFYIPNIRFIKDFPYRIYASITMEYLLYLYKLPLFFTPTEFRIIHSSKVFNIRKHIT